MSWLDDNQMPTVGYPNPQVILTEYSEEDSRDVAVCLIPVFNFFYQIMLLCTFRIVNLVMIETEL